MLYGLEVVKQQGKYRQKAAAFQKSFQVPRALVVRAGPPQTTSTHWTSPNHALGAYLAGRIRPCEAFFKPHSLAIYTLCSVYIIRKTPPLYRYWRAGSNDIYINIY